MPVIPNQPMQVSSPVQGMDRGMDRGMEHPDMHPMRPTYGRHPPAFLSQADQRIYELNKRLQQRTEDSDNLFWDSLVTDFFDDEARLTLSFCLEDGPKRYSIGRVLIPRYFRTIFEGGVSELYYTLKQPRESIQNGILLLECDHTTMVTHHVKPMITTVYTDGQLILEMSCDDMRIRHWNFTIRQHREYIPRNIFNMHYQHTQDPAIFEQLSKNITRQGLTNVTLNYLRLCVILEPMQELMSRHKTYGLSPRDSLRTTLFQKWQRIVGPTNIAAEPTAKPGKRRKRKQSNHQVTSQNSGGGHSKKKGSAAAAAAAAAAQAAAGGGVESVTTDVMVVGEPTMMGGEFGDEDERLITRLENTQYNNANGVITRGDHEMDPARQQWNSGGVDQKPGLPPTTTSAGGRDPHPTPGNPPEPNIKTEKTGAGSS